MPRTGRVSRFGVQRRSPRTPDLVAHPPCPPRRGSRRRCGFGPVRADRGGDRRRAASGAHPGASRTGAGWLGHGRCIFPPPSAAPVPRWTAPGAGGVTGAPAWAHRSPPAGEDDPAGAGRRRHAGRVATGPPGSPARRRPRPNGAAESVRVRETGRGRRGPVYARDRRRAAPAHGSAARPRGGGASSSTPSTARRNSGTRTTSASPTPHRVGGVAPAPPTRATRCRAVAGVSPPTRTRPSFQAVKVSGDVARLPLGQREGRHDRAGDKARRVAQPLH